MRRSIIRSWPLAAALASSACTNVFLQPDRVLHMSPDRVGVKWEEARFRSDDGVALTGLWFPASRTPAKGVVVQFHGNGENMTSHFLSAYWLALEGWDVLAFDYRGYGASEGSKSLNGSVRDGAAALAFARAKEPGRPLVVLGQSLGGAVALASLARDGGDGLRALVLDSTFSSYKRMVRAKAGRLFTVLVSDRYAPDRLIASRRPVPLLVLHAHDDPVVPYAEGKRLFELAPGPKEFWDVPGSGHAEAFGPRGAEFRPRLSRFLDEALPK